MAIKTVGLKTHIWNNNVLTFIMLLVLPGTLLFMVWVSFLGWFLTYPESFTASAAGYSYAYSNSLYDYGTHAFTYTLAYLPTILAVVALWYVIAWFFNRAIILSATGAKIVTRKEERGLYNLLENLCISRGIKTPTLAIIETDALNAFASGIDEDSYTVTVTRGLINVMSVDELEAVIAHELTHIQNNDVRLMVIISIFAGMISTLFTLAKAPFSHPYSGYHMGYGLSSHSRSNRDGRLIFLILGAMLILMLASAVTNLVKLYISRRREFMADAGAVELTRNPSAMIRALRKIEGHSEMPQMPAAVAEMCISPSSFSELFSTHPTTDSRIQALKDVAGYGLTDSDTEIDWNAQTVTQRYNPAPTQQKNNKKEDQPSPLFDPWSAPRAGFGARTDNAAASTATAAAMSMATAQSTIDSAPPAPRTRRPAQNVPEKVKSVTSDPWQSNNSKPKRVARTQNIDSPQQDGANPWNKTVSPVTKAKSPSKTTKAHDPWSTTPTAPRSSFGQR